jgi:PAS domain S-box-containing protein
MKIRVIIIMFAALAFLTSVVGGTLYYYSMKKSAVMALHKETIEDLDEMAGRISLYLSNYQKIAASMSGLKEIRRALTIKGKSALNEANAVLAHFQSNIGVDVCYLIDRSGTTIASSNHNTRESFVGKNYAFRPYFTSALAGNPSVYMALGVVTGKRGVYYSHAVYDDSHSMIVGVVVVKAPVDYLEHEVNKRFDGVMTIVNTQGVIFVSSREDWLLHTLWKETPDVLSAIASTRQFGSTHLKWTGLEKIDEKHARDAAGNRYMIHEASVQNCPGWKVLFLHDLGIISDRISGIMLRQTGFIIILICLGIGVVSIVLYRKANSEILKRKSTEEELKNTNTTLQAVIKASPLPIVGIDAAGTTVVWNPAAERVFGWSEQEVLGRQSLIVPQDLQQEHISFRSRIVDDDTITGVETRRMRKDGTLIDVTVSSATIHDEQGTSVAAMGIYEDITESKKAQDEVRFLAAIIQDLPDAVCAIDTAGRVVTWNSGASRMLGYSPDEIIGKPITHVIPEDIAQHELDHCLTILNKEGFFSGYESVRLAKDGKRVPVELTAVAIKDRAHTITHYASIMIDLTDRKKAEDERLKVHMLESIGFLAEGIAHDFNNLLSVILGNIHIAKMSLPSDEKAFSRLTDAESVIDLASELSKRLITFATGGDPRRMLMPLSDLFVDTITALLKGSSIQIAFDLPEDLADVSIDEGQMKQVINNLVINAKEAMPNGGMLTVRGRNIQVSSQDNFPMREGHYLHLSISDTGAGIPAENLARIFDPYFSTKTTYSQKGLGLGLAVCYSIIKKHDGLLTVESEVGRGTTYHIYLPVTV